MSTAEVFRTAEARWASAKPRLAAALDRSTSVFQWLALHWKLIGFNALVLPVLGLIYWTINGIGLRMTVWGLGMKLYRLPGLSTLRHYQGWRDLDLANVAALGMLALVWVFTVLMMHIFVYGGFRFREINEGFANKFILCAGIILIIADAVMFSLGLREQSTFMSGDGVSLPQIIMAVAYATGLLCIAFLHVLLENHNN